jgi:hypothetical protein
LGALLMSTAIVSFAHAQQGSTSLAMPKDAPPVHTAAPGPYKVIIESNPALPKHTIYRPEDLSKITGSKKLPIVAWGNGACSNAGLLFETFLTNVASHGYMIIVSGEKNAPLPAYAVARAGGGAPAASNIAPAMTKDEDMQTALNWAVAEATRKDSQFYRKLNPSKIAVMGQSCGGLQTIANSGDKRVKTSIVWNSGTFGEDNAPAGARSISGATKASLAKIHAPILYINGGPADLAYANSVDDVKRINNVPVFHGWINVGHGGTFRHPGGGWYGDVGVAWLDWRLKGDRKASKMFVGKDCGLCTNPIWHVEKKKMK